MSSDRTATAVSGSGPVRARLRAASEAVGLRAVLLTVPSSEGEIVVCASTARLEAIREGGLLPDGIEGLDDHSLPIVDTLQGHVVGELRWVRGRSRSELEQVELQALGAFAEEIARVRAPQASSSGSEADADIPASDVTRLLAALATRSVKTAWEIDRVIQLSESVARELGTPRETVSDVLHLAMLREVGNLGIPAHVLEKRGLLTRSESRQLREQPVLGERIVAAMPDLAYLAPLIRASQEHWDGSGYPDGLRGEQIPLASRIVSACNAYVAMVSERPFRKALPAESAVAIVAEKAGSQFCPASVAALERVLELEASPPGPQPQVHRREGTETAAPTEEKHRPAREKQERDEHAPAALVPPRELRDRPRRSGAARVALARDRTPDRAARILYPLGLVFGTVLGVIIALPIDSAEGRCPPPGAEARTQCILQKVWLHELTVVFVVVLAVMLAGYLAFFKLPDAFRRWRTGELFADRAPPPVSDDPAVIAATWGYAQDAAAGGGRRHPHWRRSAPDRGKTRSSSGG